MYIKTEGLILRETALKDTDKLLTVLTRDAGKLTLKAPGVRGRSSRLKAACQLLAYSEFTIFEYKGYHSINEAEPIELFAELRDDLDRLSLASYMAQVLENVSDEDRADPRLLSLGLNSLYALCRAARPIELIKAAFELRLICQAGYQPELEECAVCGSGFPEYLELSGGQLLCAACAKSAAAAKSAGCLPVSEGCLAAMRYITLCEPKKLFSFTLGEEGLSQLSELAERYLLQQLGKSFPTLDFYKSLKFM